MPDIIKLLPDSVANQIAAGEVIQRPASVIKELVENAVDAGATEIQVIVKDAGRTLLQVIDNGKGMSETDARMAFERHATSKINKADDLFALHTKGFRGEALASIAAIAHVELQTRPEGHELGTRLVIKASEVETQEPCACQAGSNFMVKNIFYNVPARRRFLKSDNTEERHLLNELYRIALSHTEISFRLMFNNSEKHYLPQANLSQRISHIFGRGINASLVPVETKTDLIGISGFVGKPEQARKKSGEQYFFANHRFMRHPYLHRAVIEAYQNMLPPNTIPSYFLFLETDPENIDINIHPTKTEIKFTDERTLWQMVRASVREALGKSNVAPSIDFDLDENLIPPVSKNKEGFRPPSVNIRPGYTPESGRGKTVGKPEDPLDRANIRHWENLTKGLETNTKESTPQKSMTLPSRMGQAESEEAPHDGEGHFMQLQKRYILTSVKSGLMLIDQRRAHVRIRYEQHIEQLELQKGISQSTLYPQEMDLEKADLELVMNHRKHLGRLGLDFEQTGAQTIAVKGMPAELKGINAGELIEQFIENYHDTELTNESSLQEKLALAMAKAGAVRYGHSLDPLEMSTMTDQLFACRMPNYTPDGKTILTILKSEELKSLLP